ncbi:Cytochrome P450 [Plasmodiophora brassicae]
MLTDASAYPAGAGAAMGLIVVLVILVVALAKKALIHGTPGTKRLPGGTGLPFVGESLSFLCNMRGFISERHRRYGPAFRTHLFGTPTAVLSKPDDVRKVLLGEGKIVRMRLMKPIHNLMDGSLLSQHGDEHRQYRRVFQQVLSPSALENRIPEISHIVSGIVAQWPAGKAIDINKDIHQIVFRLSQTVVFGRFDEELTKVIDPLFQTYNRGMISLPVNLPWTHYGSAIRARRKLANVIAEEVAKRDSGDHEPGLVAALLDEEGAQVPAQAMLGLLAGYETTAFTIAIVLHTMARYPDIIERLHKEHVTIMGSLQPITQQSDLKQLTLLDAAVRESMRLFSTAPVAGRVCTESFTTSDGFLVPAGYMVFVGLDALPTRFASIEQREQFLPDRYLNPETAPKRWDEAPFGGGPRSCVGSDFGLLMVKLVVSDVVRRYRWRLPDAAGELPPSKHSLEIILEPRPSNGTR